MTLEIWATANSTAATKQKSNQESVMGTAVNTTPFFSATMIPDVVHDITGRLEANAKERAILQKMLAAVDTPLMGAGIVEILTASAPVQAKVAPTKEQRAEWKDIKGSDARQERRAHLQALFAAGGHQTKSNATLAKQYGVSKSLISLLLNEAVKAGTAESRTAPGGRATRR